MKDAPRNQSASLSERRGAAFLWQQMAESVQKDIHSGKYAFGTRLPTELELAETFKVHRSTVRRALQALRDRGIVRVEQGRGIFVQERMVRHQLGPRTRLTSELRDIDRVCERKFLRASRVRASGQVAADLGILRNHLVQKVDTLTQVDGVTVSISSRYFPLPRFSGIEKLIEATGSLTKSWLHYGVDDYRRYEARITAISLSSADADILGQAPKQPAILLTNINVDAQDVPITVAYTRLSPQRMELVVRF